MEVTLINTNQMPNGWLASQLNGFLKDLARDFDGHTANVHFRPTR